VNTHLTMAVVACLVVVFSRDIWRRLRLRRALFILSRQVRFALRDAPRSALVLEVGSGHNPHLRSDVLCDKYLDDDSHRAAAIEIDRPLVIGDAAALPFKTKAFDVVFSSHMIEHLDDPRAFFDEAGRVAHAGLFTAPSAVRESLFSDLQHKWLVRPEGSGLRFVAKRSPIVNPIVHDFLMARVIDSVPRFDRFILAHWADLEIEYAWVGAPSCVVEGVPSGGVLAAPISADGTPGRTRSELIRMGLRSTVRGRLHSVLRSGRRFSWEDILACPSCRGDVTVSESQVRCTVCQATYSVESGIPIMLREKARATAVNGAG
jgi:uncharacterized protein YbaR (Trm112 family)/SAM-dependent methyltransferase